MSESRQKMSDMLYKRATLRPNDSSDKSKLSSLSPRTTSNPTSMYDNEPEERSELNARDNGHQNRLMSEDEISNLVQKALTRSRQVTDRISPARGGKSNYQPGFLSSPTSRNDDNNVGTLASLQSVKSDEHSFLTTSNAMSEEEDVTYFGTMSMGSTIIGPSLSEVTSKSGSASVYSSGADEIFKRVESEIANARKAAEEANRRLEEVTVHGLNFLDDSSPLGSPSIQDSFSKHFDSAIIFGKEYATNAVDHELSTVEVIHISSSDEKDYEENLTSFSAEGNGLKKVMSSSNQEVDCIDLTTFYDSSSPTETLFQRKRTFNATDSIFSSNEYQNNLTTGEDKEQEIFQDAVQEPRKSNQELIAEASGLLGLAKSRRYQLSGIVENNKVQSSLDTTSEKKDTATDEENAPASNIESSNGESAVVETNKNLGLRDFINPTNWPMSRLENLQQLKGYLSLHTGSATAAPSELLSETQEKEQDSEKQEEDSEETAKGQEPPVDQSTDVNDQAKEETSDTFEKFGKLLAFFNDEIKPTVKPTEESQSNLQTTDRPAPQSIAAPSPQRSMLIPPAAPEESNDMQEGVPTYFSSFFPPDAQPVREVISYFKKAENLSNQNEGETNLEQKPKASDSRGFDFTKITSKFHCIADDLKANQSSFDTDVQQNLMDSVSSTMSEETTDEESMLSMTPNIDLKEVKEAEIEKTTTVAKTEEVVEESSSDLENLLTEALEGSRDASDILNEALEGSGDASEMNSEDIMEDLNLLQKDHKANEEEEVDPDTAVEMTEDDHLINKFADKSVGEAEVKPDEDDELPKTEATTSIFTLWKAKEQENGIKDSLKKKSPASKKTSRRVKFKQRYPMPPLASIGRSPEEIINAHKSVPPKSDLYLVQPKEDVKKLIDSIFDPSITRRFNACGAMKMLTGSNKKNQLQLARTDGFLDALIFAAHTDLSSDYETARGARNRAISTLLNLAAPKGNRLIMFSHPCLVECMVMCAIEDKDETRMLACSVIAMLAKTDYCREPLANVDKLLDVLAQTLKTKTQEKVFPDEESDEEEGVEEDSDDESEIHSNASDDHSHSTSDSDLDMDLSAVSTNSLSVASTYSYSDDDTVGSSGSSGTENTGDSQSLEACPEPQSDEQELKASTTACAALLHLSRQCGAAYIMCTNQTLLHVLVIVSQDSSNPMHSRCLEILTNLTKFPENSEMMAKHPGLLSKMVNTATSDIDEDRVLSLKILQNISASSAGKVLMINTQTLTLLSSGVLRSNHFEEQTASVAALHNLSTEPGCLVALTNTKDVVASLVYVAHDPNTPSSIRLIVCDTLATLGLWIQTLAGAGTVPPEIQEPTLPTSKPVGWKRFD